MLLKELKKYNKDFNEQVIAYLNNNRIKTIGDFRKLTVDKLNSMPANAKQKVLKNTVSNLLGGLPDLLMKVKL